MYIFLIEAHRKNVHRIINSAWPGPADCFDHEMRRPQSIIRILVRSFQTRSSVTPAQQRQFSQHECCTCAQTKPMSALAADQAHAVQGNDPCTCMENSWTFCTAVPSDFSAFPPSTPQHMRCKKSKCLGGVRPTRFNKNNFIELNRGLYELG